MPDLIGKTLGPYRILEQIGVGGMAAVFRAYQPAMDRDVALKILPVHITQGDEFALRFQREAQAIARLEHPHILPVYDYGEAEDITYIAMRYIRAGTLRDLLGKGRLPLEEINRLIGQIASALDHAHRQGVIHRDVKPSNVLVDQDGNTYLTDFGLARMLESSQQLTASGVGLGTPAYMSPEQGQGVKVDHRSDIYSLGVILYEMVTGHVPYEAETPMGIVLKHITEPLPLPRTVQADVPESIERVILKALAKDPAHRYFSAGELAQALDKAVKLAAAEAPTVAAVPAAAGMPTRVAAGEAVRPAAPPRPPLSDWLRQHARQIALGGGALILVAVLGWGLSQLPGWLAARPTAASTQVSALASPVVTATPRRVTATPMPPAPSLRLTMRLHFSSSSDWADLVLVSEGEFLDARVVESGGEKPTPEIAAEERRISLRQPIEASETGQWVFSVVDLTLGGVPADQPVRFETAKGCNGVLQVQFYNFSVGEPILLEEYAVEGCHPPSPQVLGVPARRLAEIMTQPPESGRIATWCDERWPGELCVYDPQADKAWNITRDQAERWKGDRGVVSWSPDGLRLVYSAAREAGQPQKLSWIFSNGGGGGGIAAGDGYDHEAAWSPTGEWIAFHRSCALWLVRPDGSDDHPLVEAPDYCVEIPVWSPDGRQIAYLSSAEGVFTGIWVVSAEGGAPHLIYDLRAVRGAWGGVVWTPDGRKLLHWFGRQNSQDEQRLLVFADGSGIAGEIDGVPYWWQPSFWPPWGRPAAPLPWRIVYAAPETGGEIYVSSLGGLGQWQLTEQPALDSSPVWSPDGTHILFTSERGATSPRETPQLYVMNADGSELRRLTNEPDRNAKSASWSPDGTRIVFHSHCDLVVMDADGSNWRVLVPQRADLCADFPVWSPDSTRIAFRSMQAADNQPPVKHDLYVVNADGSGLRRLASLMSDDWSRYPAWSPDGRQVVFDILRDGQERYFAVNADGGEPEEIEVFPEDWCPWFWPQWGGRAERPGAP